MHYFHNFDKNHVNFDKIGRLGKFGWKSADIGKTRNRWIRKAGLSTILPWKSTYQGQGQ